jgi:hypothetical protein
MLTDIQSSALPVPVGPLQISRLPHEIPPRCSSESTGLAAPVRFSLIVPTSNEGGNVDEIIRILSQILDQAMPHDYELIIVDDDSPDLTWAKFNIICLMELILKILLLNILFNALHLNVYLSNFLAIALVTLWNFWINLKLSWRVTEIK